MAGDDDRKSGVAAFFQTETGFDLNARQLPAMLHQNVVGIAVSVRPRDANAFAGGAQHESEFGKISHAPGAEVSGRHVSFACFQGGPVVR